MKELEVTAKEMRKCLDVKKIIINLIVYFTIYAIIIAVTTPLMYYLYLDVTLWAIILAITGILFLILFVHNLIRLIKMLNAYKHLPVYKVKLDKVNYYMNKKIPVFLATIPTKLGTEVIETNAIYKLKDIPLYKGHMAKVLYDSSKNRIYIISLLN